MKAPDDSDPIASHPPRVISFFFWCHQFTVVQMNKGSGSVLLHHVKFSVQVLFLHTGEGVSGDAYVDTV